MSTQLKVFVLPALSDNYIFVIRSDSDNLTAVVDPCLHSVVNDFLAHKNWSLDYIFCTHHHWDHIGGNEVLKEDHGAKLIGSKYDAHRIPSIDAQVKEGSEFMFASHLIRVMFLPGHTTGHIAYYIQDQDMLFSGDTLFSMGCGRLFEGTAEQLHSSLTRIAQLPTQTEVYCAHEYTQKNSDFALATEGSHEDLQDRINEIKTLRGQGLPTIPTSIGLERKTNPFLRLSSEQLRKNLDMEMATDLEVFTHLRKFRDSF